MFTVISYEPKCMRRDFAIAKDRQFIKSTGDSCGCGAEMLRQAEDVHSGHSGVSVPPQAGRRGGGRGDALLLVKMQKATPSIQL